MRVGAFLRSRSGRKDRLRSVVVSVTYRRSAELHHRCRSTALSASCCNRCRAGERRPCPEEGSELFAERMEPHAGQRRALRN